MNIYVPKREIILPRRMRQPKSLRDQRGFIINPFAFPSGGGGGGSINFLTGHAVGTARHDFTGSPGVVVTVGAAPVTVTDIGRWVIAGNNQSHTLRIYDLSDADIGNVTVNTSGAPSAAFLYGALGTAVMLAASSVYLICSDETFNGDDWSNNDATITWGSDFSTAYSGYFAFGSLNQNFDTGHSYGPIDFKYHL